MYAYGYLYYTIYKINYGLVLIMGLYSIIVLKMVGEEDFLGGKNCHSCWDLMNSPESEVEKLKKLLMNYYM